MTSSPLWPLPFVNRGVFREEHIFTHFFNITNTPQRAFIVFHAKDGGTMLRPEHIREMYQIDKVMTDALENADHWGVPMCHPICHLNTAISIFWVSYYFPFFVDGTC